MKMANNCKSLLIKITESKENKSINRLDLSGSTGRRGGGGGAVPPCSPASDGPYRRRAVILGSDQ